MSNVTEDTAIRIAQGIERLEEAIAAVVRAIEGIKIPEEPIEVTQR